MERLTYNEIIYETFAGMCKALKVKEGVMNKEIAIDMGIDFSIFSKLLSGKRVIGNKYRDKIFNYFNSEIYTRYADDLKLHICGALCLTESSMAYKKITAMTYSELLKYLFYEYNEDDLIVEDDVRALFVLYVKKFFGKILEDHAVECGGYKIVSGDDVHALEEKLGLPENYVIEIGRFAHDRWEEKIYILLCPQLWHKGREFLKNPDTEELAECYMAVRLKDNFTEDLLCMNDAEDMKDTAAEFETFRTGCLCRKARQLADLIFKKICENNVIPRVESHLSENIEM